MFRVSRAHAHGCRVRGTCGRSEKAGRVSSTVPRIKHIRDAIRVQ